MERQSIRETAGRMFRSDELNPDERETSAALLRANPELGNPHMVRCDWCYEMSVLFRDEDRGVFERTRRGWRCTKCNEHALSQEVRF
ncbi:MAG: hypothetical protein ACXW29_11995 [Thermoanaerobaculia bacterium]